jgi:hypothetical protein
MKRLLVVSLILTLVVASSALGSSARWQALGNEHRFIIDTSNYGVYPGRVHQFSNAIFVIPIPEFGNNNVASGFLKKINDNMTGAFHFNLPSGGVRKLNSALKSYEGKNERLAGLDVRTWPDLFWAMKMDDMTVGARVSLAMDKNSTSEISTSAMALDANAGVTLASTAGDVDLGVSVGIQSFSDDDGSRVTESTGGFALSADARLNKPMGEKTTIVPVLNVNIGANPTEKDAAEVSYLGGDIGLGYRLAFENRKMVVAGLVLALNSVTIDDDTTTTIGPKFVAGCETPLTKWLVVRGGANAVMDLKSNSVSSIDVNYYYNMGFRIMYGGFIFDAIVSRDIFHRGPSFVSGSSAEGNKLATNVCLTYVY